MTLLFALVISLPVILFELYGFVLPAFSPRERRIAMPLLAAIPFLFVIGVAFGYFVVLPAALRFFQNFNSGEFNVLVQANPYYKFVATILLAMGLVFQVPVAILVARVNARDLDDALESGCVAGRVDRALELLEGAADGRDAHVSYRKPDIRMRRIDAVCPGRDPVRRKGGG